VRNIRSNPRVPFHLDGDGQGGVLTIDAVAEIVEGKMNPTRWDACVAKYDSLIRDRLKTTPAELRAQFSTLLQLKPAHLRSW
jgi:hypothetical protein